MRLIHWIKVVLVVCGCALTVAVWAAMPAIGEKAPLFESLDQAGKPWRLADHAGKRIILMYFYPKDNTPGCTVEACGWRDRMEELKKANVEVVGVSFDSAESHRKFILATVPTTFLRA